MPADPRHSGGYEETPQSRGWRQMSARLDREMPVDDRVFVIRPIFAVLLVLLLSIGLGYWMFYEPSEERQAPIATLEQKSIALLPLDPATSDLTSTVLAGKWSSESTQSNQARSVPPNASLIQEPEVALQPLSVSESVIDRDEYVDSEQLIDRTALYGEQSSPLIHRSLIPEIETIQVLEPKSLHEETGVSIDEQPTRTLPARKSVWLSGSARLHDDLSATGYAFGIGHQWSKDSWSIRAGGVLSMLDVHSFYLQKRTGREVNEEIAIRDFAFEEGAYQSYAEIYRLADRTRYAGLSVSFGYNLFSGLFLSGGTSLQRIIGGQSSQIKITQSSAGEEEQEMRGVNVLDLVDQGVINPWMWKASAGLTWHFNPGLAMTIRYEQPVNNPVPRHDIAIDERLNFYWIELGMNVRIMRINQ